MPPSGPAAGMKGKAGTIFLDSPVQFDSYRPRYHVQPHAGWLNDPNGPVGVA